MGSSIRLFRLRGIDIRVHVTFPLILVWAALQFGLLTHWGVEGALFGVLVTLLLFAIVLLHELGHALVALAFDIPIHQIVLLPIGGVAQLERMPESPFQEFLVALAGPLVNLVLALLMAALGWVVGYELSLLGLQRAMRLMGMMTPGAIFGYVFVSNLFIGAFNLLPAFPMDGGRILRALLAARLPYERATGVAVIIGQALAWLLGLWGFLGGGFFAIVIAIFIYLGAAQERQAVRVRSALAGLRVEQAYSRQARALSPDMSLRRAVELTLKTFQASFPVCEGDRLVGLLTQTRLIDALHRLSPDTPVAEVMLADIRPVSPRDGLLEVQQRLSEEKVEALPVVEDGRFLGLITSQDISELYRLITTRPEVLAELP